MFGVQVVTGGLDTVYTTKSPDLEPPNSKGAATVAMSKLRRDVGSLGRAEARIKILGQDVAGETRAVDCMAFG